MFSLQGKAQGQIKSKHSVMGGKIRTSITECFDFAPMRCPEGQTLKGSMNTIIEETSKLNDDSKKTQEKTQESANSN